MRKILIAAASALLLSGCEALGPVGSPEFGAHVARALPAADNVAVMSGTGAWLPSKCGRAEARGMFVMTNRPQVIAGVLVLTQDSLFMAQWNGDTERYDVAKRWALDELRHVRLDSFDLSRRVVLQSPDYTFDSVSSTQGGGQLHATSKTEELHAHLARRVGAPRVTASAAQPSNPRRLEVAETAAQR